MNDIESSRYLELLADIKQRIRSAHYEALKAVNKELIGLYWDIGRIIQERQKGNTWGKAVVEHLADDLQKEFPGIQGFSARNIWYMRDFYVTYFKNKKLQPLVAEISWTKNVLNHQIENKSYEKYLLNQTNFDNTLPDSIKNLQILRSEVMDNKNLSEVIREFRITPADGKNDFSEANIKNFRQFYLTFAFRKANCETSCCPFEELR